MKKKQHVYKEGKIFKFKVLTLLITVISNVNYGEMDMRLAVSWRALLLNGLLCLELFIILIIISYML